MDNNRLLTTCGAIGLFVTQLFCSEFNLPSLDASTNIDNTYIQEAYKLFLDESKKNIGDIKQLPPAFDDKVIQPVVPGQNGENSCGFRTIRTMASIVHQAINNEPITGEAFKKGLFHFIQNTLFSGLLINGIAVENVPLQEVEEFLPKLELYPNESSSGEINKELLFGTWLNKLGVPQQYVFCTYVDGIYDYGIGYQKPDDNPFTDFIADKYKDEVAQHLAQLNDLHSQGIILFPFVRLASMHWLLLWVEKKANRPPMIYMVDSLLHADLDNRPDVQFFINYLYAALQPGHQAFKEQLAFLLKDEQFAYKLEEEEKEFFEYIRQEQKERLQVDEKFAQMIELQETDEYLAHRLDFKWREKDQQKKSVQVIQDEKLSEELFDQYQTEYQQWRSATESQIVHDEALGKFVMNTNLDVNRWVGWTVWQTYRTITRQ